MSAKPPNRGFGKALMALFAAVVLVFAVDGYAYYRHTVRTILADKYSDLSTIGELKAGQIAAWRKERLADADLHASGVVRAETLKWLHTPADDARRAALLSYWTRLRDGEAYEDVILAAPDGRILLSVGPSGEGLGAEAVQFVAGAATSPMAVFSDFYRSARSGRLRLDVAAPIRDDSGHTVAVLLLRTWPDQYLYPLIQSWPMPSRSGETLIVRKDGGDVLFLNKLRHRPDPPLTVRVPLSRTEVPSVQAVLGRTGVFRGVDNRGVDVVADLRPVPGSPWFMVAKMDTDEILAENRVHGGYIAMLVTAAIVLTGLSAVFLLKRQESSFFQSVYRAEQKLSRARAIMAASNDSMFVMDPASARFLDVNDAACAHLGYSREELLGLSVSDLDPKFPMDEWPLAVERTRDPGGLLIDTLHRKKDGSSVPVEINVRYLDLGEGQFLVASARDVSERRRTEEELHQYRDHLEELVAARTAEVEAANAYNRTLLEADLDPLFIVGDGGKMADVNRAAEEATGLPRERLIGTDFCDCFTSPDRARSAHREALAKGQVRDCHLSVRHQTGRVMDVLVNANVYRDPEGKSIGVLVSSRDFTERMRAEDETRRQIAVVEAINTVFRETPGKRTEAEVARVCLRVAEELTDSALGLIHVINQEGLADAIALVISGREGDGTPEFEAAKLPSGLPIASYWGRVVKTGTSQIVNAPLADPDRRGTPPGHPEITAFLGVPLKRGEETFGIIGLANKAGGYSDTDREMIEALSGAFVGALAGKRAELELERYRLHLEDAVEERSQQLAATVKDLKRSNEELEQFAYVASHDLQEPLRTVASYTQLLAENYGRGLDEKAAKWVRYTVDGAQRMQWLINDLLTYSRVTTRGGHFKPVDSHAMLGRALENLRSALEESCALVTMGDLPEVQADPTQLTQLFQNLIGNAVKFRGGEAPRIHVSAGPDESGWDFSIRDNGIGIDAKYKGRLFILFQRLHTQREYPGTGIGLAVCKRIVERHGGRIWFDSEPGKGATFHFVLPATDNVKEMR